MWRDEQEMFLKGLEAKRAKVMPAALEHLHARRYAEAEKTITAADDSIYGMVALGRMYTARLKELVANCAQRGDPLSLEVFERALHWKQRAYPEPHTEYEAQSIISGQASDRAELVAILGCDPSDSNQGV